MELFRDPEGSTFAWVPREGHRETWPLRTKQFRAFLARLYFAETGKAPGSQALADALAVLDGKATFGNAEHWVYVRVGEQDGVDLPRSRRTLLGGRGDHGIPGGALWRLRR